MVLINHVVALCIAAMGSMLSVFFTKNVPNASEIDIGVGTIGDVIEGTLPDEELHFLEDEIATLTLESIRMINVLEEANEDLVKMRGNLRERCIDLQGLLRDRAKKM